MKKSFWHLNTHIKTYPVRAQTWPALTGEMIVGQKESIPSVGSQDPISERK